MSDGRYPMLDLFYQQYLTDESSAEFIHAVSRNYSIGTLERLALSGARVTRRASILALGFVGDFSVNEIMGKALVDTDRGVRLLADHGIRQVWQRQGTRSQQEAIRCIYRLVDRSRMEEAIDKATSLISVNPELGEAWNQRAIAYGAEGEFAAAMEDCREALSCNRFHFPAAMGMAHCAMRLEDTFSALDGFRLALTLNPDLDHVRKHIQQIERALEDS